MIVLPLWRRAEVERAARAHLCGALGVMRSTEHRRRRLEPLFSGRPAPRSRLHPRAPPAGSGRSRRAPRRDAERAPVLCAPWPAHRWGAAVNQRLAIRRPITVADWRTCRVLNLPHSSRAFRVRARWADSSRSSPALAPQGGTARPLGWAAVPGRPDVRAVLRADSFTSLDGGRAALPPRPPSDRAHFFRSRASAVSPSDESRGPAPPAGWSFSRGRAEARAWHRGRRAVGGRGSGCHAPRRRASSRGRGKRRGRTRRGGARCFAASGRQNHALLHEPVSVVVVRCALAAPRPRGTPRDRAPLALGGACRARGSLHRRELAVGGATLRREPSAGSARSTAAPEFCGAVCPLQCSPPRGGW